MNITKDQLNEMIRDAVRAVSDAEMEGLRGAEMLAVKAELRSLKARYAKLFK